MPKQKVMCDDFGATRAPHVSNPATLHRRPSASRYSPSGHPAWPPGRLTPASWPPVNASRQPDGWLRSAVTARQSIWLRACATGAQ
jgi:hypothetical protein